MNQGHCTKKGCKCHPGFTGLDCSETVCVDNCTSANHGMCVEGKCVCTANFTGPACADLKCPKDCSGNGKCVAGACKCDEGFITKDCSKPACWPKMCSKRGSCVKGACQCSIGWAGADCDVPDCGAHGTAVNGTCKCEDGYTGDRCLQKACPQNCNGHGGCLNGTCICNEGWVGPACSLKAMAPQRPHKCGVHCVRKCLRTSEDLFKTQGMAASRSAYNNCTKTCIALCLRATPEEHESAATREINHPEAVDIPDAWMPSPPPKMSILPVTASGVSSMAGKQYPEVA